MTVSKSRTRRIVAAAMIVLEPDGSTMIYGISDVREATLSLEREYTMTGEDDLSAKPGEMRMRIDAEGPVGVMTRAQPTGIVWRTPSGIYLPNGMSYRALPE